MSLTTQRERRRREALAHMQAAQDALADGVRYSEEQQSDALRALGRDDLLPEPQARLPLPEL